MRLPDITSSCQLWLLPLFNYIITNYAWFGDLIFLLEWSCSKTWKRRLKWWTTVMEDPNGGFCHWGYPKMGGLWWKILCQWMIWLDLGVPQFYETSKLITAKYTCLPKLVNPLFARFVDARDYKATIQLVLVDRLDSLVHAFHIYLNVGHCWGQW